ncbi:PA2169 family four-helix-bundle protein [Variovorax sp. KK3]|uniref:ferritin-like domain-containing protein n=1 Tax=Variovorax sp. KK3 TaxID=1855728 RepID=UPI00097C6F7B|nr:PA2169 family four-helix-bundle protein [Variovorax sp. KK3]
MAVTTTGVQNADEVVDVLNDLIENSRDGEYGFRTCAEEVESPEFKRLFNDRAAGCAQAASELSQLITAYGGKPAEGGTATGAMHRGWVHVKGMVGANSDLSMLEECERGEDAAIARYRKALKQELPADVRSVVERQAEGAQRNHDQIRDLRNQARERS